MPTDRERIEKWSLSYHILKYYVDFAFRCYYRVTIAGEEKINFNDPLIFAPNHQNALMDALAVLCSRKWQPVFLARGDIFKGRFMVKALTFLKILPVFRMRDGFSTLQQNDATFRKTMDVLENRNGLLILPEGSHLGVKRLRQLKKGIARIGFQAEEAFGFDLNLKIVPVGLDYSYYKIIGSRLLVNFGEPISIAPFLEKYRESPPQAYNALMAAISDGMKSVMLHIDDEEHHDEVLGLVDLKSIDKHFHSKERVGVKQQFEFRKALIDVLNKLRISSATSYDSLVSEAGSLMSLLKQHGLSIKELEFSKPNPLTTVLQSLLLVLTLPVFVYAFVNVMLPVGLARYMSNKFKDIHFHASVRFVIGLLAFPVFFLIQTLVFGIIAGFSQLTLFYFLSLPLSAVLAYAWRKSYYTIKSKWKFLSMKLFKKNLYQKIVEGFKGLNMALDKLV